MYGARPRRFSSVQEKLMVLWRKPSVSRCRLRAYSVPFVFQHYYSRTLLCNLLYLQRLSDFMPEQSEHERMSESCRLKLHDCVPLQKSVNVESVQAVSAGESMQTAENLQSQQTHILTVAESGMKSRRYLTLE